MKFGLYAPCLLIWGHESGPSGSSEKAESASYPGAEGTRILEGTVTWSSVCPKSYSPSLRGRPGDDSHASDSLAPGPEPWSWP
ncbi:zinc finger protein 23 isoform X4 [Cynocephalus volans]|uniref:zinc finger protein 23 isoform X4 n=1 Tax=Cynocephalus volans TaxID=110931 RepID=UPI002FCB84BB